MVKGRLREVSMRSQGPGRDKVSEMKFNWTAFGCDILNKFNCRYLIINRT